jgi:hypothetical protein
MMHYAIWIPQKIAEGQKVMTSKVTAHRLSLAGLVGLIVAYCFLAKTVPILAVFASDMMPTLKNLFELQRLYLLGFSLLVALWGTLNPGNLAMVFPAVSLVMFIFVAVIPATIIVCVILAAIVGADLHSWVGEWVFPAIYAGPLILINIVVVLLLAGTAKGLKQNKVFKQWEIFVLLLGSSWIGLAIGWSIGS